MRPYRLQRTTSDIIVQKKENGNGSIREFPPVFDFCGKLQTVRRLKRRAVCEIDYDWGEVTISPLRTCSMSCLAVSTVVISGTMTSRCQSG